MGKINICTATDNNYIAPLSALIASVLYNAKKDDDINFFIITNNVSEENKARISSLKKIKNSIFNFIDIKNDMFSEYLSVKTHQYLTITSFYRLKLTSILPQNIEKIIYLDSDMIVNTSLEELFNIELGNNYAGGVIDISPFRMNKKSKLPLFNKYINSGMLLINLKKLRNDNIEEQFYKYAKEHYNEIYCGDQQIINVVLKNKIKIINPAWNVQTSNFMNRSCYVKEPYIIHYVGYSKPWIYASFNYFKQYWFKYIEMTSFSYSREEKFRYEVQGQKESIIRYILHRPLIFLHPKFWYAFICTYILR